MNSIQLSSAAERSVSIRQWARWMLLLVFSVAMAAAAYKFDLVLSRFLARMEIWPGDTRRLIAMSEYFAHGTGVLVIIVLIWMLDPRKLRYLPRVAACAFVAGLAANIFKLCVSRRRPLMTDASISDISLTWASHPRAIPVGAEDYWDYAWQSFPSAHAATAVGFAIGLSWLYPRAKYLFWGLAALAALQRVVFLAHWPSDVLVGVSLGIASGFCYTIRGTIGNWMFTAWEARCSRRGGIAEFDARFEPEQKAA